ncbi:MAG TPA: hypothetical protein VFJ85_02645 [Acidimicrobiales bacterium]|nr:hypothetical protein [Acidimicrobiales bacterium]
MPDVAAASTLLRVTPAQGRAAVRAAFRDAVRRGRPDLGAMPGEHLARLLAARDALLAVAPDLPPAGTRAVRRARQGSPALARKLLAFDAGTGSVAGALVDAYA